MTSEDRLTRLERMLDNLLEKRARPNKYMESLDGSRAKLAAAEAKSKRHLAELLDIVREQREGKPPESSEEGDRDV